MAIERKNIDMNAVKEAKIPIIFVLGGPGSGKGTQCDLIVQRYGFTHLSSGDLLRAEIKSGSSRGKQLNDSIEKGELVPMEVVLDLIKETMVNKLSSSKGYILDGYPREVIQGTKFEDEVCSCTLVIYFDVSDVTMTERLLNRGKTSGRVDDNEETIKKRLKTFHDLTKPVIDHYCGKVITISAEPEPEIVFQEVTKAIDSMNC